MFELFVKKNYKECNEKEDAEIIKKHKEWIVESNLPLQLANSLNPNYYCLTQKGIDWVDKVNEIIKKRKNG